MQLGDLQPYLLKIQEQLNRIDHHTNTSNCCEIIPQAGTADAPSGLTFISIIQSGSGTTVIIPFGGNSYTLSADGQSYVLSAPIQTYLPAFTITTTEGATAQWYGI